MSDDLTRIRAGWLIDVVTGEVLRDRVIGIDGATGSSRSAMTTDRRWSSICPSTRCSLG